MNSEFVLTVTMCRCALFSKACMCWWEKTDFRQSLYYRLDKIAELRGDDFM
ncbi:hypothetical protein [Ferviditalea candida]|uniref:Uncharacterized protein n=1 Tax=Ferviditalea candida TaxID=3108399 RepID=A0ABU5ZN77_9BACL|nr:hypothetical protein [Paenibacillaceae bacterium T2]